MSTMFPFAQIVNKINEYLRLKAEQLKLEVMGRVSKVLALVITFLLVAVLGLFFALFLALTLAVFLNYVLESEFLGYLIVSGIILLKLVILIVLLKTNRIQRWIESAIMNLASDE